jgi:hypothetical protein
VAPQQRAVLAVCEATTFDTASSRAGCMFSRLFPRVCAFRTETRLGTQSTYQDEERGIDVGCKQAVHRWASDVLSYRLDLLDSKHQKLQRRRGAKSGTLHHFDDGGDRHEQGTKRHRACRDSDRDRGRQLWRVGSGASEETARVQLGEG